MEEPIVDLVIRSQLIECGHEDMKTRLKGIKGGDLRGGVNVALLYVV